MTGEKGCTIPEHDSRLHDTKRLISLSSFRSYDNDDNDDFMSGHWFYKKKPKKSVWMYIYMVAVHVALITATWNLLKQTMRLSTPARPGSFSPPSEAIQDEIHENRVASHSSHGKYAGPPSPENNKAWDSLMLPTYFSMSEQEMIAAGETVEGSAQLKSGGYVAVTGAYHELHCLRQIRLYLYKTIYYPNLTESQEDYLRGHLDHCLELLREEVMCSGDVSVYTFFWHDPPRHKPGVKTNSKRTCINWERFERWSLEHMVSLDDAAVMGGPNPLSSS